MEALEQFCQKNNHLQIEVIFVDDGSTDNSVQKLAEKKSVNFTSRIIQLSRNFGSHAALRAGLQYARGQYITFTYADLQDPLELISQLYEKCHQEDCEIVWASRNNSQGFFSKLYARLMRVYVDKKFPPNGFDIVMFSQKVQQYLNQHIEANSSVFIQILIAGFRQTDITYTRENRKAGKSKWTFSKKVKLLTDSFVAFSYAPIRFVTWIGFGLFGVGSLFAVYLIIRKLALDDLEQGWAALISILMIGFGVTNISLGIIAEYLWRTLDASRKRPVFIIDKVIEL